jgi:hypothetical protein
MLKRSQSAGHTLSYLFVGRHNVYRGRSNIFMTQRDPNACEVHSGGYQAEAKSVFKTVRMSLARRQPCAFCCRVENAVELAAIDPT